MSICHRILLELYEELNHLCAAAAAQIPHRDTEEMLSISLPDKRVGAWAKLCWQLQVNNQGPSVQGWAGLSGGCERGISDI